MFTISDRTSLSAQTPDLKVSVVIPSFNNEEYILETLESVQNQTHTNFECIIIDDGSTDRTPSIVHGFAEKDSRFRIIPRPETLPKGANSCRNYGASSGVGEFLLFLDADDLLSESCIESRLNNVKENDLLIGSTGKFSEGIANAKSFFPKLNPYLTAREYRRMFLEYLIPWHTSSGFWKKEFFEKIGGFDLGLQRFQDVEIHVRALTYPQLKLKIDLSGGFISFYRQSEFHKKMTLEKRRYILEQSFYYLKSVKRTVEESFFGEVQGFLVYLLFRFEEVVELNDFDALNELISNDKEKDGYHFNSIEFRMDRFIFESMMTSPNILRKYLSYGLYRSYQKRKVVSYT